MYLVTVKSESACLSARSKEWMERDKKAFQGNKYVLFLV